MVQEEEEVEQIEEVEEEEHEEIIKPDFDFDIVEVEEEPWEPENIDTLLEEYPYLKAVNIRMGFLFFITFGVSIYLLISAYQHIFNNILLPTAES